MNDLEFISYFAYFIFIFLDDSIFISVYDFQYYTSLSNFLNDISRAIQKVFIIYDSKNPKNINNARFVIQTNFNCLSSKFSHSFICHI